MSNTVKKTKSKKKPNKISIVLTMDELIFLIDHYLTKPKKKQ